MKSDPSGRVALVTGAAGDFGRAIVKELASAGWIVAAAMREPAGRNCAPAHELETAGYGRVFAVGMDVNSDESVGAAVRAVVDRAGRIDMAVNNAGRRLWGPLEVQSMSQARELFETNVFGMLRVIQAVVPIMRAQASGLLVYISSGLGRVVRAGVGLYAATKWAGEAIAQTLRYELAPFGIDSVIVEPGAFDTALFRREAPSRRDPEISALYDRFMKCAAAYGTEADVTLVSRAVLRLAETPRGQRPTRTEVGLPATLLMGYNEEMRRVQEAVHKAAGTPTEMLVNGY